MYRHNSTIRITEKICNVCGKKRPIFSKGACQSCATIRDTKIRMEEETERVIVSEGLSDIIERLDDIYSKWLRLSSADEEGRVQCYTCPEVLYWTAIQCGHYESRGNMRLRWDTRNTRPQCETCNQFKHGNLGIYTTNLELEWPGITDILHEESTVIYKPSRHELNQMILEYTQKFKALKK